MFKVSKLNTVCIKQEDASEDSAGTPELGAQDSPTQSLNLNQSLSSEGNPVKQELIRTSAVEGELSEISDSDDDILNKTDKVRPKNELPTETEQEMDTNADEVKSEALHIVAGHPIKGEEGDEVLDFEEISDGELEEDARHKGESLMYKHFSLSDGNMVVTMLVNTWLGLGFMVTFIWLVFNGQVEMMNDYS